MSPTVEQRMSHPSESVLAGRGRPVLRRQENLVFRRVI